jgi:hypothetical protein
MDNRSAKLPELPVANAISNSCLFYIVDDTGESKPVNAAVLAQYIKLING